MLHQIRKPFHDGVRRSVEPLKGADLARHFAGIDLNDPERGMSFALGLVRRLRIYERGDDDKKENERKKRNSVHRIYSPAFAAESDLRTVQNLVISSSVRPLVSGTSHSTHTRFRNAAALKHQNVPSLPRCFCISGKLCVPRYPTTH